MCAKHTKKSIDTPAITPARSWPCLSTLLLAATLDWALLGGGRGGDELHATTQNTIKELLCEHRFSVTRFQTCHNCFVTHYVVGVSAAGRRGGDELGATTQ